MPSAISRTISGEISGEDRSMTSRRMPYRPCFLSRWWSGTKHAVSLREQGSMATQKACLSPSSGGCANLYPFMESLIDRRNIFCVWANRKGSPPRAFGCSVSTDRGKTWTISSRGWSASFWLYVAKCRGAVKGSLQRFRDFVYIDDVVGCLGKSACALRQPRCYLQHRFRPTHNGPRLAHELLKSLDLPARYPVKELPGSAQPIWPLRRYRTR